MLFLLVKHKSPFGITGISLPQPQFLNNESIMKKLALSILTLLIIIVALPPLALGFNVWHLGHAVQVATSLSAKLACSGHHISGLNESQIRQDLSSYSPVTELVELEFNPNKSVKANLFGLAETTARFDPHLGCTVNYDNGNKTPQLSGMQTMQSAKLVINEIPNTQAWPKGNARTDINQDIQQALEKVKVLQLEH